MEQYVFDDMLGGIRRKLTLVENSVGLYTIYWDANMLGILHTDFEAVKNPSWYASDPHLEPYAKQLGDFIVSCKLKGRNKNK